ncbi:MAG: hypothetical protein ACK5MT_00060 [Actinomycetales bacterium]
MPQPGPVMVLGEQTGLSQVLDERVRLESVRVAAAGVNPAGKITTIIDRVSAPLPVTDYSA